MKIEIRKLDSTNEGDYNRLLSDCQAAMFNHSIKYRDFLREILDESEDNYLLAYRDGELAGALPLFVKRGPLGAVVNSLPFYGSHGGVLTGQDVDDRMTAALLEAFSELCDECGALCSTLIESPFDPCKDAYARLPSTFSDMRIGQITTLPGRGNAQEVEEHLLSLYHQKTRNSVRKGLKGGFTVGHEGSRKTLEALHAMHEENIRGIGGIAKPWRVFQAISDVFEYDRDYRIYTAEIEGRIASALLVFYFKGMVEYFTPATLEAYRSQQPLSLLIFRAMCDAVVERGSTHWNWGGTWLNQEGVYQFKSRWGTADYPYRYHIRSYRETEFIRTLSKSELLDGYPYFYTVPFSALEQA